MKKHLIALAICLTFFALISGCSAPGSSSPAISLSQAQEAFIAVSMASLEAWLVSMGDGVDDGTVGTHMKRRNTDGTVFIDWNPSDGSYPSALIITCVGYLDSATGYLVNGTMVANGTSALSSSEVFDLTLSHSTKPVDAVTGTLTKTGGIWNGSLSFNGVVYTYAELNAL